LLRIVKSAIASLGLALAASPALAGEIEQVEAWLNDLKSLKTGFSQVLFNAEREPVQESSGLMYIERPGRFRWEYHAPFEQVIISDGATIWMYDAELSQVTKRQFDETIASSPAMLLSGDGDLNAVFVGAGQHRAESVDWITLQPKRKDSDFQAIRLGFVDDALAMMELTDNLDQVTQIRFFDLIRNAEVSPAAFAFEPPAGVDVIDETELGLD